MKRKAMGSLTGGFDFFISKIGLLRWTSLHRGRILLLAQPRGEYRKFPQKFRGKIMDVAEINQRRRLEESGQQLENVDQTHLDLASGKLAPQKIGLFKVPWLKYLLSGFQAALLLQDVLQGSPDSGSQRLRRRPRRLRRRRLQGRRPASEQPQPVVRGSVPPGPADHRQRRVHLWRAEPPDPSVAWTSDRWNPEARAKVRGHPLPRGTYHDFYGSWGFLIW